MTGPGADRVVGVSRETSPPALPAWLGPAADGLHEYARLLAGAGVQRGLIGPREVGRLWERHILNCAVVAEPSLGLIRAGVGVADIGSGAGLPGLTWALARPDLHVVLVEPLLRRSDFLGEAVRELGLGDRVTVRRTRAEDMAGALAEVVTARAVAPLDRLAGWTMPLVRVGGVLLALKGRTAEAELDAARDRLRALGAGDIGVVECGAGVVEPPTTVVRVVRDRVGGTGNRSSRPGREAKRRMA